MVVQPMDHLLGALVIALLGCFRLSDNGDMLRLQCDCAGLHTTPLVTQQEVAG
jgi:hypothetical protein